MINYKWKVEDKARLDEHERQRKFEAEHLEKERREKLEEARVNRLLRDARTYEQAGQIRKYVDAIRAASTVTTETSRPPPMRSSTTFAPREEAGQSRDQSSEDGKVPLSSG